MGWGKSEHLGVAGVNPHAKSGGLNVFDNILTLSDQLYLVVTNIRQTTAVPATGGSTSGTFW